ncbi:MAG: hypothetical protein WC699_12960 [Bacteroidales bacterium]|jgi:hypothetical protein
MIAVNLIDRRAGAFNRAQSPAGHDEMFNFKPIDSNMNDEELFQWPEEAFHLFHEGILRSSGTISVTEASDSYKANLMVGSGDMASRIKDLKLKDLDLGGVRTWEWKTEYKYPDDDFALFPVKNTKLMEEDLEAAGWITNKYRLNSFEDGAFYQDPGGIFAVAPYPFLAYMIRRIMAIYGFQIKANIFESNKDFRDLVIYHNHDITGVVTTTSMESVDLGVGVFGNQMTQDMLVSTVGRGITTFDLAKCMPDMLISDFLISLRNLLNIAFVFDSKDHVSIISRQDLVMRATTEDITELAIGIHRLQEVATASGFKLIWNHDDDDTIFADGFKKLDDDLALLKDPVADLTALAALTPELNEIRFVQLTDAYYQYARIGETSTYTWTPYGIGFQNYLDGLMEEVFETQFSTLIMETWTREVGGPSIRLPKAEQMGNSATRADVQPFSPRLLFYRGLVADSDDDLSPMGSNDNLDRTGTPLTGKYLSLKWQGDYGLFGLYPQLWRRYLTWWMTRKLVYWTIKDPSSLRFDEKYSIDGKHYLLKKRTINLTQRGVEPGECEFYLV